jgi:hypothetical protein
MKLVMNHEQRILELWFAQGENVNAVLPPNIELFKSQCKKNGYLICMYHSGSGEVTSLTSALLADQISY